MTESKYTPGPWELGTRRQVLATSKRGLLVAQIATGTVTSTIGSSQIDEEEAASNARLIAAAPDLLEALKDARFSLYGNGPGNPKIDAAIAKAEGHQ